MKNLGTDSELAAPVVCEDAVLAEVCDGGRSPAKGPVMVDSDDSEKELVERELVETELVKTELVGTELVGTELVAVAGSKRTVEPPATRTVPLVAAMAFWELVAASARLLLCFAKVSDAAWELEAVAVSRVELLVPEDVKDGPWVVEVTSISTYTMMYQ